MKLRIPKSGRSRIQNLSSELLRVFGMIIIIGAVFITPFFIPFRQLFQGAAITSATGVNAISGFIFAKKANLVRENEVLRSQLQLHTIEEATLYEERERILELESLLEYRQSTEDENEITAMIISKSAMGAHEAIINRGAIHGVQHSSPVIAFDGHLIGVVSEIREYSSTITLLESQYSSIPAKILSDNTYDGLVTGKEGFAFEMQYLELQGDFEIGDLVVTSGIDGILPSGLVIGIISEITRDSSATFASAHVEPIINHELVTSVIVHGSYAP